MIVWLNGTFGVGKTSTARSICAGGPHRLFDPEFVGYMVAGQLEDHEFDDFQDLPPWRALVAPVAKEIHDYTGTDLVAVQSVLDESYWHELQKGMLAAGLDLVHVLLDCEESELRRRIETDQEEAQARQWRLDHLSTFAAARPWMQDQADLVIDTTDRSIAQVATEVLTNLGP